MEGFWKREWNLFLKDMQELGEFFLQPVTFGKKDLMLKPTKEEVIEKSEIVIEEEGIELEIELNYKDLENFKYYCNKNNINIIDVKYSDLATCLIEANFVEKENITSNTNLSIQKYKIIRKKYIRKNVEK